MMSTRRTSGFSVAALLVALVFWGCASDGVEHERADEPRTAAEAPRADAGVARNAREGDATRLQALLGNRPTTKFGIDHRGLGDTGGFHRGKWRRIDRYSFGFAEELDDVANGQQAQLPEILPSDELWVITRFPEAPGAKRDDVPGCGALRAKREGHEVEVPIPLKHTDVKARVSGWISTVDVTQQFHNPYDEKIEARYVFPLPTDAAITDFIMTVGERRIRGIIRKREEAEKIYEAARARGHVASLLTQERPNVFTQSVANIEPGKRIDIDIRYFHTLAWQDGSYEFTFPMVVGPRFNPPHVTDGVGAVARGDVGTSGQATEVSYLRPDERSGHDISLRVEIDAGVSIESLECPSHVIGKTILAPERATVALDARDSIPNRDFVLRWRVAGETIKSAFLTSRDENGGHFALMVYPPENLRRLERKPVEMIFVLDCSGSMSGEPLAKSKAAMRRALKKLRDGDTFQIIRFSSRASALGASPVPATPANVRRGLRYVEQLKGSGGTMMIEGIKAALDFPYDEGRTRLVSFMTDGYIGNEGEILAAVHEKLGAARIFSFGIGNSVNRYLLEGLARLGRGAVAWVGLDENAADAVDAFYDRIARPALTDIEIDWGGLAVSDVFPKAPSDLFVGRPMLLTGRFEGKGPATVRVRGRAGSAVREIALDVRPDADRHPGVAAVWARTCIADLEYKATHVASPELGEEVARVALEYGLVSSKTSFVAVDSKSKTAGEGGATIDVPVPVPPGVRYETTVGRK